MRHTVRLDKYDSTEMVDIYFPDGTSVTIDPWKNAQVARYDPDDTLLEGYARFQIPIPELSRTDHQGFHWDVVKTRKRLAQDDGPQGNIVGCHLVLNRSKATGNGGKSTKRGQMAHAYPPTPHKGGRRVAFVVLIVVILGFVGGIILRSTPAGTVHHQVTHSAVHSPVKPHETAPAPHHPAQAPKPHRAHTAPQHAHRTYTVRNGDTLWSIAAHVYHNPLDWHKLYELNHSLIGGNPNLIHTGTVLQLE